MKHPTPASPAKTAMALSELLGRVSAAIASACQSSVWVVVEVMELRRVSRHVYLGLSERNAQGVVLAKTSGVIWGARADSVVPAFEQATGARMAPGLKLLVRARPVFKREHGFNLEIDAIDEHFTLGDFEVRKKEIRQSLQAEGLFAANRSLPPPWDFNSVLVVAPESAAGLGDFQAEASRLAARGICSFDYCFSRFQGDGAGAAIRSSLIAALKAWKERLGTPPDAIVIIRGGGAVNDLAWLDDLGLVRLVCRLPIPVLTGIGHERDQTLLDEVANASFSTPSKVIAGIERVIIGRARQAQSDFASIAALARQALGDAGASTEQLDAAVRAQAQRHLAGAKRLSEGFEAAIAHASSQKLHAARSQADAALHTVKHASGQALATARAQAPALMEEIALGTQRQAGAARLACAASLAELREGAVQAVAQARHGSDLALQAVSAGAAAALAQGRTQAQAYVREITGQGPEKTLRRGFALVQSDAGQPMTRAAQAQPGMHVQIQFSDGAVPAHIGPIPGAGGPT